MSVNIGNEITAPSINSVELTYKQKFPTKETTETINGVTITPNGVAKNTIKFNRLEDMIVMCLSTFVHDYVHDYNLGTMHARVIKGNIIRTNSDEPSLFEKLGITIGNTIVKIMTYNVGGHRDVSMYDDSKFKDDALEPGNKKDFSDYLETFETPIETIGGAMELFTKDVINGSESTQEANAKGQQFITAKKQVKEQKVAQPVLEPVEEEETVLEPVVAKGIIEEVLKSITFNDVKDTLNIPSSIPDLDFGEIVTSFERTADFLAFHSSLNK